MKTIDEMIEILEGVKAGKEYEYYDRNNEKWWSIGYSFPILLPILIECFKDQDDIRLAPEPKLVPYGPEDGAWLVGRKARMKHVKNYGANIITESHEEAVWVAGYGTLYSFESLLDNFLDVTDSPEGVPFGREEK